MKLKKVFQRKETKYLLTHGQFEPFFQELTKQMEVDEFGKHTILSLYFDTKDFQFIQKSMEKPKYKEKFRVRSYGVPQEDCLVFLEIKKKVKGIVYKRRLPIPYSEYCQWLATGKFTTNGASQIAQEITWLFSRHADLQPKTLIAYDRLSLFGKEEEDFRVTFDQNIRYRTQELVLEKGSNGELVAPEIDVLMEVKALGAYPIWFVELLNNYGVRKGSFSKYAETFKRHLFVRNKEEITHVV